MKRPKKTAKSYSTQPWVSFNLGLTLGLVVLPVITALIAVAALTSLNDVRAAEQKAQLVHDRRPIGEARAAAGTALDRLEAIAYQDLYLGQHSAEFDEQRSRFESSFAAFMASLADARLRWTVDRAFLDELARETARFEEALDLSEPHLVPEVSWRWFSSVDVPTVRLGTNRWRAAGAVVSDLEAAHGIAYDHFDGVMAALIEGDTLAAMPTTTADWIRSIRASNDLEASSTVGKPISARATLRILREVIDPADSSRLSSTFEDEVRALVETSPEARTLEATTPFLLGEVAELEIPIAELLNSLDRFEVNLTSLTSAAFGLLEARISNDLRSIRRQRTMRLGALALPALLALALLATMESRRHRANQTLISSAETDPLTGLPNRSALQRRTEFEFAGKPTQGFATLLLMDIDNFKAINDTFGHHTGDRALAAFARAIKGLTNDQEQVYRLGGDEFVVLSIEQDRGSDRVAQLADQLHTLLERPLRVSDHQLRLETSCGASTRPLPTALSDLLVEADLALHEVKEHKKSSYLHYRDTRRGPLIRMLQPVLERRGLDFAFQPQISMQTGHIVGLEALCRWPTGLNGSFRPIDIVDSVEWLGHVHLFLLNLVRRVEDLDRMVGAAFEGRYWLNVWPSQLEGPDPKRSLLTVFEASDLDLHRIGIEVTEKRLVKDAERTRQTAAELREAGVAVAMDDFGIFNASIDRLTQVPLDTVKLDQKLVQGISTKQEHRLFIKALQEICSGRSLKIIAEGVEEVADLVVLRELKIDEIQGFVASPALLPDELLRFLSSWSPEQFVESCRRSQE